jgi:hypothetical protein
LDTSADRSYQSGDYLSNLSKDPLAPSQGGQPLYASQPYSASSYGGASVADKGAATVQQGMQKLGMSGQMQQQAASTVHQGITKGTEVLQKMGMGQQSSGLSGPTSGFGTSSGLGSSSSYPSTSTSTGPSIVDKGMAAVQQGMQKMGMGQQSSSGLGGTTSGLGTSPFSSTSTGPSIVDKGAAAVQQGMQSLGLSGQQQKPRSREDRPLLERTDDREIVEATPVTQTESPLLKILNTFNLMDTLENTMSSASESSIPGMRQTLIQYEETIRNLVTIMENSEQGQRIIRHLTEMINIIQNYLEEFAPPTESHAAQQWIHNLNIRLKRIDIQPNDGLTEVLTLLGLNEYMDRLETTPGVPIVLSRLGRFMKAIGGPKMTEHQTKSILKDSADLATLVTAPMSTALDEGDRTIGNIQNQGGLKETIRQAIASPSDPDAFQGFVDTIKEWTLSVITTVLPTIKLPQYEGETPSVLYKVGKIDLSHVNITRDMVNVSVDQATGQIFTKVAGVDIKVHDLPWRVKHKKLKVTSSGLADAVTKDATWSMGLGLNYNTQVPDIPAIVLTSPPCLKLQDFDVHVKSSKLSPFANLFMGLFRKAIKNTIENRVEEEIERTMVQNLDNLNIAVQKTAPRVKRLVELGRLLVFKGQQAQQHVHEQEKSVDADWFEDYQPGEDDEYESEDQWEADFEQRFDVLRQPAQQTDVNRLGVRGIQTIQTPVQRNVLSDRYSDLETTPITVSAAPSTFVATSTHDYIHPQGTGLYSDTFQYNSDVLPSLQQQQPMVSTYNLPPLAEQTTAPSFGYTQLPQSELEADSIRRNVGTVGISDTVKPERLGAAQAEEHGQRQHSYRTQQQFGHDRA